MAAVIHQEFTLNVHWWNAGIPNNWNIVSIPQISMNSSQVARPSLEGGEGES